MRADRIAILILALGPVLAPHGSTAATLGFTWAFVSQSVAPGSEPFATEPATLDGVIAFNPDATGTPVGGATRFADPTSTLDYTLFDAAGAVLATGGAQPGSILIDDNSTAGDDSIRINFDDVSGIGDPTEFDSFVMGFSGPQSTFTGESLSVITDATIAAMLEGGAAETAFFTDIDLNRLTFEVTRAGLGTGEAGPQPVPVPRTLPLLLAALGGLSWLGRRRRNSD